MSLIPLLFGDSYFMRPSRFTDDSYFMRPSRLFDQHFGQVLDHEDLLRPVSYDIRPLSTGYLRNWRPAASEQDSASTIVCGKDQFSANLDVQQFKPQEITVKVTGENVITIEGKHEEKEDEHGHIYRHFVRRYTVPKNYDINKIESKLSSDGVLSISAPKIDAQKLEHKNIPVTQTGIPAKAVQEKKEEGVQK